MPDLLVSDLKAHYFQSDLGGLFSNGLLAPQRKAGCAHWSYDVAPRTQISIRVQTTLRIPEFNCAPEPDLLWVRRRRYSRKHPEPADVLLLAEVAESSLGEDRGEKRDLYARAMIAEYWIVNLVDNTVEVYREPDGVSYQWSRIFRRGDAVTPLSLPNASLLVSELLPA